MANEEIPSERSAFEAWCKENGIETVILGSSDTNGTWLAKRIGLRDLLGLIDSGSPGLGISDVCFVITRDGYDCVEPAPETRTYFPNKENGFPDIHISPDLETARRLPWRKNTVGVNGTFVFPDGTHVPIAPRSILRQQVERAAERNLVPKCATEFEFYLIDGSPDTLYPQNYPLVADWPRPNVYQAYRSSVDAGRLANWEAALAHAGVHVEAIHPENGPGQYEFVTKYTDPIHAGDDAFTFKNGIKEMAALEEKMATFIAVPKTEWPGSSCHIHQSLWTADTDEPLVEDPGSDYHLSTTGRHYLGGLLATMREFTVLFRPTINSYKRAREYSWAGTTVSWGLENRSTGVRVTGEGARARRFEQRVGGSDVNPYLAMAACLAGGLYGIEHEIEPPEPTTGDAYVDKELPRLPGSLSEAVELFNQSQVARSAFGDAFVNHYVAMKRAEVDEFNGTVTDWEVRTYAETA